MPRDSTRTTITALADAALDFLVVIEDQGGGSYERKKIAANNLATELASSAGVLLAANDLSDLDTLLTAQQNLELEKGVDVQAYDAALASLAALGTAADKGIYATDVDTFAEFDLTAAGRAILDDADATAQRATLEVLSAIKVTVAKDLALIAATTEATETFAVTGAVTTDTVSVSVAGGLDAGLIITNAWVSAADTVSITFYNLTGSAVDQASKDFYITLHK